MDVLLCAAAVHRMNDQKSSQSNELHGASGELFLMEGDVNQGGQTSSKH